MIEKIVNYFGNDKILHFLVGSLISSAIAVILLIQDGAVGGTCIAYPVLGFIVSGIAGLIKESIIDSDFDWKNLVATLIGGATPIIATTIEILFYTLSN